MTTRLPFLLGALAVPLVLVGVGALGLRRFARGAALSSVLLSLGVALLVVVAVALLITGNGPLSSMSNVAALVIGAPVLAYLATLVVSARRTRAPARPVLLLAALGLAVLYHLGGGLLMLTVCGIDSRGC